VLSGLTHLGVLEVLLLFESTRICHSSHERRQSLAYDLVDFVVVVLLHLVAVSFLLVNEVTNELIGLASTLRYGEGLLSLHLVKSLVDVHEAAQEGWSCLDQVTSKILSRAVIHLEPDVAFPKSKDLSDDIVLEELHASENVEHSRLLHPLA